MKTLKVSDGGHEKLTALLGELTARTGKIWTYMNVIHALLKRSVKPPTKLIAEVESFVEEKAELDAYKKEFKEIAAKFNKTIKPIRTGRVKSLKDFAGVGGVFQLMKPEFLEDF